MEKVLVVSVHPDDETIGCGGTILKHKLSGDKIYWLILTNVDTLNGWKNEIVVNRQKEIENVASSYGFDKIFKLDFPTTKLDQIPRNL
ncbi:MAG: PIG-L family deacetylase, partial [Bacteroidales bacterium]